MAITAGTVNLGNTIVGNNSAGNGPDISGSVNSLGYNLVSTASGASIGGMTAGNQIGVDPLLMALADNGGPTLTHRPFFEGSPVVDGGGHVVPPVARITDSEFVLVVYVVRQRGTSETGRDPRLFPSPCIAQQWRGRLGGGHCNSHSPSRTRPATAAKCGATPPRPPLRLRPKGGRPTRLPTDQADQHVVDEARLHMTALAHWY